MSAVLKLDNVTTGGMITAIWGPPLWHYLHTMSFYYPVQPTAADKKKYMLLFSTIGNMLPCSICRDNFKKNIQKKNIKLTPKVFESRLSLSLWVYNLHNVVRKHLGQPITHTYEDISLRYESFRALCVKKMGGKKMKGCTVPTEGYIKKKIVMCIVPRNNDIETFTVSGKCLGK